MQKYSNWGLSCSSLNWAPWKWHFLRAKSMCKCNLNLFKGVVFLAEMRIWNSRLESDINRNRRKKNTSCLRFVKWIRVIWMMASSCVTLTDKSYYFSPIWKNLLFFSDTKFEDFFPALVMSWETSQILSESKQNLIIT